MKTLMIIALLIVAGYILVKIVLPIIGKLLGYLLAAVIPILIVVTVAVALFISAAAFVGLSECNDEDGGAPMRDTYELVDKADSKIENKIDSMEGGKVDLWIKKQQDKINSK